MAAKVEQKPLRDITKDITFNVEAIQDDKALVSQTSDVPIRVRVKVHNKNDLKVGNNYWLSLPDSKNKILKHSASDQTILSFKLLMQPELDKNTARRPRKSFINRLLPGVCLGIPNSDDEGPYMPVSPSIDNNNVIISPGTTRNSVKQRPKNKYKPGGCLDPPFGEENYAYAPPKINALSEEHSQNKILNKGDILIQQDKRSSNQISQDKRSSNQISPKSSSLITYPASTPKSKIEKNTSLTMSNAAEQKRRSSQYSESAEIYFKPTKTKDTEESQTNAIKFLPNVLGAISTGTGSTLKAVSKQNESNDEWNPALNKTLPKQIVYDSKTKLEEESPVNTDFENKTRNSSGFKTPLDQNAQELNNKKPSLEPTTITDKKSFDSLDEKDDNQTTDKFQPSHGRQVLRANAESLESISSSDSTTGKYLGTDTEIKNEDSRGYRNLVPGIVGVGAVGGVLGALGLQEHNKNSQNETGLKKSEEFFYTKITGLNKEENLNKYEKADENTENKEKNISDDINKKSQTQIKPDFKSYLRTGNNKEDDNYNLTKSQESFDRKLNKNDEKILSQMDGLTKHKNNKNVDSSSSDKLISAISLQSVESSVENRKMHLKENDGNFSVAEKKQKADQAPSAKMYPNEKEDDNFIDKLKEDVLRVTSSSEVPNKNIISEDTNLVTKPIRTSLVDERPRVPTSFSSDVTKTAKPIHIRTSGVHLGPNNVDDFYANNSGTSNNLSQIPITELVDSKKVPNNFSKIDTKLNKDTRSSNIKRHTSSENISGVRRDKKTYKQKIADQDKTLGRQVLRQEEADLYKSMKITASNSTTSSCIQFSETSVRQHHQPIQFYKYRYDTPQTQQQHQNHVKMDIAFKTYVDKNKDLVIKTLDPRTIDANSSDNITKKKLTSFSEDVEIPITSGNMLLMRLKSSTNKFPTKTQHEKTPPHITPKSNKPLRSNSMNDVPSNSSNAKRNLSVIDKCLGVIYEQQLVPLQKTINNLKEELQTLTLQQSYIKQKKAISEKSKIITNRTQNRRCRCHHN